jgi:hypothetical protein
VVPEADPVMHGSRVQCGYASNMWTRDIGALPRKWCLEKAGGPERNGKRSQGRSADTLRQSIASPFGCLLHLRGGWQSPWIPSLRSACDIGSAEHVGHCTNEQAQNVLSSAASQICATPQSPDDASVAVQGCLLMQATPQPCTRPVNFSLAVLDSSSSN